MSDIMRLAITPQELAVLLSGAFLVHCRASVCMLVFVIRPSWTVICPPFPYTFFAVCKEICFITQEIISLHKLLVNHMCSKPRKEQCCRWSLLSRKKFCKLRKSLFREMLWFLICYICLYWIGWIKLQLNDGATFLFSFFFFFFFFF